MVRAWYMDDEQTDQRLEHHRNPKKFIQLDELLKKTGVEYFPVSSIPFFILNKCHEHCGIVVKNGFQFFQLDAETYKVDGVLDQIRKERGYSYEDEVTDRLTTIHPKFDGILSNFTFISDNLFEGFASRL